MVDAEARFLAGLAGVTDPEAKRKFIGAEFVAVFEEEANKLGGADFLAQGTLYPDVIESVSFTGGPIGDDQEPPQCRRAARADEYAAGRTSARVVQGRSARAGQANWGSTRRSSAAIPFPGPGLAIRIPGRSDQGAL